MQSQKITDERSANDVLKGVAVGDKVQITFKAEAGDKLYERLSSLRHKLDFDFEWLVLASNSVAAMGGWGRHSRTQDFTVTRMSPADREIFANILAEIAESIEIL